MRGLRTMPRFLVAAIWFSLSHSTGLFARNADLSPVDWWKQQKRECGLSPSLAYNTWVDQGMPCNKSVTPIPEVDFEKQALDNANHRFSFLVAALADRHNLLDKPSWLALPRSTVGDFESAANQLHHFLVNKIDGHRFREAKLREELAELDRVVEHYPATIADLRAYNNQIFAHYDQLVEKLNTIANELELTQRSTQQLLVKVDHFEQHAIEQSESLKKWFDVILPIASAQLVTQNKNEHQADPSIGTLPVRHPIMEPAPAVRPVFIIPAKASHYGIRAESHPPRLTDAPENIAAQLEADVAYFERASADHNFVIDQISAVRPGADALIQQHYEAIELRDRFHRESDNVAARLRTFEHNLQQKKDKLRATQEMFLFRTADAWLWQKAKSEVLSLVTKEVKRQVASLTMASDDPIISDIQMHDFYNAGRRNIYSLNEKHFEVGSDAAKIIQQIHIIQNRGQNYAQIAVELASNGTYQEIQNFVAGMFTELDSDSEELVKRNLSALKIPEPWQTISAKYLLSKTD